MLDPIFALIALGVFIAVSLFVYLGHVNKYHEVMRSGDQGKIRNFAVHCCNANRYHLIVLSIGMSIMTLVSLPFGLIFSAIGLIMIQIRGVGWFLEWLISKIKVSIPL